MRATATNRQIKYNTRLIPLTGIVQKEGGRGEKSQPLAHKSTWTIVFSLWKYQSSVVESAERLVFTVERVLETVNALALCAPLCSSFPGYCALKCPHSRLSNPAVPHFPPPFMPTNITVATVSFIKSFFFHPLFFKTPAISVIDPERLCWLFCLLGRAGVYWPSNGSRNPSPWARVFFNPNLWIINFDHQKCYEAINGAFMRVCQCGHGAILVLMELNLKGDAWPASVLCVKVPKTPNRAALQSMTAALLLL